MDEIAAKIIAILKKEDGMTFHYANLVLDRTKFLLSHERIDKQSYEEK